MSACEGEGCTHSSHLKGGYNYEPPVKQRSKHTRKRNFRKKK